MKSESKFIQELESRALEQRKLVSTELIPAWAKGLGGWLAVNPWRVIVPLSATIYILSRLLLGSNFVKIVLQIFGGFE